MLVYQSTKSRFLGDVETRGIEYDIAKAYLAKTGRYAPEAELRAWRHSLEAMSKVLDREDIASNAGIAVEFGIPQTSKRIDFLISGIGADGSRNVVIVELKQWSTSKVSDGIRLPNAPSSSSSNTT